MSKISKNKKQQIALIFVATAGVVAGIWYLVILGQNVKLANAQKSSLEMKEKVLRAENLLKKSEAIANGLEENTKKLDSIEEGMASGDIYSWVINTINQFNQERRVTFLDFQREILGEVGLIPKFPYKAATYPIRGVGYYHELGKFLANLENKFPYIRVQNLELAPADKNTGDAEKLSFKFEIVTLIKPNRK